MVSVMCYNCLKCAHCDVKQLCVQCENLRINENEVSSFWLRKTKKLVLAVLLVEKDDGTIKLFRGTNMEV